jgi:hypothetical protein
MCLGWMRSLGRGGYQRAYQEAARLLTVPKTLAAILLALAALAPDVARCGVDDSHCRGGLRFPVARGVDCVLVPVRIGTRDYLFMVDTGATCTIVDRSLREALGEALGTWPVATPTGTKRAEFFAAPDVALAGRALRGVARVMCAERP